MRHGGRWPLAWRGRFTRNLTRWAGSLKFTDSVTLSEQGVAALDRSGGGRARLPHLLGLAVGEFLQRREGASSGSRDLAVLDRAATG